MRKYTRYFVFAMVVAACLAGAFLTDRPVSARSPSALPQEEIDALVALYNATDGTYWTDNTNWLSGGDPCDWFGVDCGSHNWPQVHVVWLKLPNNNLNGTIPAEITNLVELDELLLNDNHLSEPIPADLDQFAYLVNLCLQNNALSGSIPEAIGSIGASNEANGGLRIFLQNNQITGTIPSSLGEMPRLRYLDLSRNALTGNIPDSFGNLDTLWEIDLSFNRLEGPIPSSMSSLAQLHKFKVSDNRLSGQIPAWLGAQPYLTELELQHNLLEGPIPAELSGAPLLEVLWLAYNRLSGELPHELGAMGNLHWLWLTTNSLGGQVPDTFVNLPLYSFWYDSTDLCEPCTQEYQDWLQTILDLKRTWSCSPSVVLSQDLVGPGGTLVVTGKCWPPNANLAVYLNDTLLGNNQSDLYGNVVFELKVAPDFTDFGFYWISIKLAQPLAASLEGQKKGSGCAKSGTDGEQQAAAAFRVDPDAPAWPSQGNPSIFDVPPGIAYDNSLYLPLVRGNRPLVIDLGDPVVPDNLYLQEGGDWDTLPITAGASPSAARRTGNGETLASSDGNQVADFYMQFDANDRFIFVGNPTQDLVIEVEYLDAGSDTFNLQYDAMYGGPFDDGRYRDTQWITKTNTGEWMTASFAIDIVYFGNRDNGGDFRIYDFGDGYEIIRKVTITLVR